MNRPRITVMIEKCASQIGTYFRGWSGKFFVEAGNEDDVARRLADQVADQGDCGMDTVVVIDRINY